MNHDIRSEAPDRSLSGFSVSDVAANIPCHHLIDLGFDEEGPRFGVQGQTADFMS
jgi:hypothetical protein